MPDPRNQEAQARNKGWPSQNVGGPLPMDVELRLLKERVEKSEARERAYREALGLIGYAAECANGREPMSPSWVLMVVGKALAANPSEEEND